MNDTMQLKIDQRDRVYLVIQLYMVDVESDNYIKTIFKNIDTIENINIQIFVINITNIYLAHMKGNSYDNYINEINETFNSTTFKENINLLNSFCKTLIKELSDLEKNADTLKNEYTETKDELDII